MPLSPRRCVSKLCWFFTHLLLTLARWLANFRWLMVQRLLTYWVRQDNFRHVCGCAIFRRFRRLLGFEVVWETFVLALRTRAMVKFSDANDPRNIWDLLLETKSGRKAGTYGTKQISYAEATSCLAGFFSVASNVGCPALWSTDAKMKQTSARRVMLPSNCT